MFSACLLHHISDMIFMKQCQNTSVNWFGQNSKSVLRVMSYHKWRRQLWATYNPVPLQCAAVDYKVEVCQSVLRSTHALQVTSDSCYLGLKSPQRLWRFMLYAFGYSHNPHVTVNIRSSVCNFLYLMVFLKQDIVNKSYSYREFKVSIPVVVCKCQH